LQKLFIRSTSLASLTPLSNLTQLVELEVNSNVNDYTPLLALTQLRKLTLESDQINCLDLITSMPLHELKINGTIQALRTGAN
ncbi:MAG: hypothetical protein ACPG51_11370, partial [Thiolinea sp.]